LQTNLRDQISDFSELLVYYDIIDDIDFSIWAVWQDMLEWMGFRHEEEINHQFEKNERSWEWIRGDLELMKIRWRMKQWGCLGSLRYCSLLRRRMGRRSMKIARKMIINSSYHFKEKINELN
jgi:hypothetical protein